MDAILGILAGSSVRAIIIAIALALVLRGMRVKSPAILHRAWTGMLLVMLMLPALSVWGPAITIPLLPPAQGVLKQESGAVTLERISFLNDKLSTVEKAKPEKSGALQSLSSAVNGMQSRSKTYKVIVTIYLIGFLVFLAKLLAGMILSYRLVRRDSGDAVYCHSSDLAVPLTAGLFCPRIFLPLESKNWDSGLLSAVLTHEMEHMRRHDTLVVWLGLLNRCIYWFHPLAWWLCRNLSALSEQSCDEAVIAKGHDPGEYVGYLLEFARAVKRNGNLGVRWASSLHGSTLALRIRRIVMAGRSQAMSGTRLVFVTALCAGATIVPAIGKLTHAQAEAFNAQITPRPAIRDEGYLNEIEESLARVHNAAPDQQFQRSGDGHLSEYYRKWLNEDVSCIIFEEEREVFLNLKTDEERDRFIERFWASRNPNPGSRVNYFKEEHYRRLAYVSERFASLSIPGWKTSRGRAYIKYGPPSETESGPAGGVFDLNGRLDHSMFPYELWRYHQIDSVGEHVTFLFVDQKGTGDYVLSREISGRWPPRKDHH